MTMRLRSRVDASASEQSSTRVTGHRRSLLYNIVATTGRQVLAILLGVALTILLARLLGPAGNGRYALAVLLPTALATLLGIGVGPANVYFVGRGEVSLGTALRTTLRLWLALIGIGLLGTIAIVHWKADSWFPGVPITLLWLSMIIFPVVLLRDLVGSLFQAVQDFGRYNRLMLAGPAANLVLVAVLVGLLGTGAPGALVAMAVGAGVSVAVIVPALRGHARGDEAGSGGSYVCRCLSYGWRSHLSNVMSFVNYRADILLLNLFLTPAATGVYVVAVQLAERLWIFSQAVSAVLLPRLAELHEDEPRRQQLTPLVARWVFVLSTLAAVPLAVAAPFLVRLLFGAEYAGAVSAFLWLLPGVVLGGMARIVSSDIAARGRPELNLIVAVVVAVTNVVGNLLLIPRLGIIGAAVATTIAYGLNAAMKLAIYARLSRNAWFDSLVVQRRDVKLVHARLASLCGRFARQR